MKQEEKELTYGEVQEAKREMEKDSEPFMIIPGEMKKIRELHFEETGQYVKDFEILKWWKSKENQHPLSREFKITTLEPKQKENKYLRDCKGIKIDVYDVLESFNVTNSATAHAIEKLLASGQRGYKDTEQDLHEAIKSTYRAIELEDK